MRLKSVSYIEADRGYSSDDLSYLVQHFVIEMYNLPWYMTLEWTSVKQELYSAIAKIGLDQVI